MIASFLSKIPTDAMDIVTYRFVYNIVRLEFDEY